MRVFSCFSGIEAASVAFKPLGFEMVGFSEVDKFCSELLKQKFPNIKNYGDITKHREWKLPRSIDFLCGGPPCQSFSIAGSRKGMDDPRGNLSLEYLSFLKQTQPRWLLMENVPGILSSNKGRDFATILGSLAKCGYGFAYAVLDAQNFGVPQRRRRVFVVGHSGGDWRRPAQVLFNAKSLFGHIEESEKKKLQSKHKTQDCPQSGITGTLCADSHPGSYSGQDAYTNRLIPETYCVHGTQSPIWEKNKSLPLGAKDRGHALIYGESKKESFNNKLKFKKNSEDEIEVYQFRRVYLRRYKGKGVPTLTANMGTGGNNVPLITKQTLTKTKVRRLTPLECERLQGFPDNWTRIAYRNKPPEDCPDGPRYKAIGNSWAVPVVRWIGERIKEFDG